MTAPLSTTIQKLLDDQQLLLIDKPRGMTSHDIVNRVRRDTDTQRVGHAGTLDPMATGLLLVLVGREATRHQDELMGMDKEYFFTAELGRETDTYDDQGEVTQTWPWEEVNKVTREKLEAALEQFRGEYDQKVPAYSAVKQHGRKLYQLARKQQEFELPTRHVKIMALELIAFEKDEAARKLTFTCRVECGSGTYIRSLAVDIGLAIGVGATVTALRRTKIGTFSVPEIDPKL